MLHGIRPAYRILIARLLAVPICLCVFVALPLPQFVVLTGAHGAESERPCHEDEDTSEEELVARSSVRRRLRSVGSTRVRRIFGTVGRPQKTSSYVRQPPAIVGHQLVNGLCAPLMI